MAAMHRQIIGFVQDDQREWIALLDCGHRQHVRHQPPFVSRPWVRTDDGRAEQLGAQLDCSLCDQLALPDGFVAYKRTPEFTDVTVPKGLTSNHSTKTGVWAKIHVLEGTLRYRIAALNREFELSPHAPGIVVPEVLHHVEPLGRVRFFVEFWRAPADASSP
jgi:tellurite methyltransferase